MPNHWILREFRAEAKFLILDDVPWEYVGGAKKGLWGGQSEVVATDKYLGKRKIKWGKPLIVLVNDDMDPFYTRDSKGNPRINHQEEPWYRANCVYVRLTAPLFGPLPLAPVFSNVPESALVDPRSLLPELRLSQMGNLYE